VLFIEFRIMDQGHEHLREALTVTYIGYLFNPCFLKDKFPESWLIIDPMFMEAKVIVLSLVHLSVRMFRPLIINI
jgi:hypothetical protein